MNTYFCVFRLLDSGRSLTCTYSAENGTAALTKMMDLANVKSTTELEEAQILQVIEKIVNGNKTIIYKPFFEKIKGEKAKVCLLHGETLALPKPKQEPEPEPPAVYTAPYTVEVL